MKNTLWLSVLGLLAYSGSCFSEGTEKKVTVSLEDMESPMKLESTFVGDKEQPGVSYFIPWKGTDTPDKLHWNIENKNDKTLELVDRDVILRSINIYEEMDLETPSEEH